MGGALLLTLLGLATACTLERREENGATQGDELAEARSEESSHRQIIQPEGVARLPVFSTAVRTGDLLFLSGQIGTLPGVSPPTVIDGGVAAETRQTMENVVTVLEAAGLGLEHLVKCTVFLADIEDYAAVNEVYASFFPSDPPARSALAGSGLALGSLVEIECIAAYPSGG